MAFWIFRVAEQAFYPDEQGVKQVYGSNHFVRVQRGDIFLYIDKSARSESFATIIPPSAAAREPSSRN